MKKGILIDVVKRSVTEIEVIENIPQYLRCEMIDFVELSDTEDIFIDESWRFNTDNYDNCYFKIEGVNEPICSNGLIMGINHETGESISTSLSVEEVVSKITFLTFIPTPKNKGFFFVWNKEGMKTHSNR